LTLTTAVYLQVTMLAAALGLTQLPWYHTARGRGRPVVPTRRFGFQRLAWLPALALDLLLALNLGRVDVLEGVALACAGLGLLVFAGGTALGFAGWQALGPNRGPVATVVEGQTLVTRGVYALVRHPVYAATVLQFLGAGLALQNWLLMLAAPICFVFWKHVSDCEDDLLEERFGQPFKSYRRRVPQLIPFTAS
jgi:protein-S-isoprenylcysteine O-methyltransferase Ste14